jgi:hypothetical protein
MVKWWGSLLLVLVSVGGVGAETFQGVTFSWWFARAVPVDSFLLRARPASGGVRVYRVAPSVRGMCPGTQEEDTFCATIQECPPLGATTFTIAARSPAGLESVESPDVVRCLMTAPCVGSCTPTITVGQHPPFADLGPGGGMLPPVLPGEPGETPDPPHPPGTAPGTTPGAPGSPSPSAPPLTPPAAGPPPPPPVTLPGGQLPRPSGPVVFWRPAAVPARATPAGT